MKHPELRMALEAVLPAPDSVHKWLSQELEQRGIDSFVYTRYIINMLQKENAEPEGLEWEDFWNCRKKAAREKRVDKRRPGSSGQDDPRKCAAVQLLLSLADTDNGIETLVDELMNKLKENDLKGAVFRPLRVELQREGQAKAADPAEQYYAAFPALPGETTPSAVSPSVEGDNIWRRKPLANQLAGETTEKLDTHPDQAEPEATDTPSRKPSVAGSHSAKKPKPTSEKRSGEQRPCKNGRKKVSPSGKKKPRKDIPVSSRASRILSWPPEADMPPDYLMDYPITEEDIMREEKCMNIEGWIKSILFHDQGLAACFNADYSGGRRRQNPSPEFQENHQWYTKPLKEIIITPSLPTQRLYKRHSFPPPFLSLRNSAECQTEQEEDASYSNLFQTWSPTWHKIFPDLPEITDNDPFLATMPPDYDSGKDSAVVSDGESCLSSGDEDQPGERKYSLEISFADQLRSQRDEIARSLNSIKGAALLQDEDDSSQVPSVGSNEEETIFHLELDEGESTARSPVGELASSIAPIQEMGSLDSEHTLFSPYTNPTSVDPFGTGPPSSGISFFGREPLPEADAETERSVMQLKSEVEEFISIHISSILAEENVGGVESFDGNTLSAGSCEDEDAASALFPNDLMNSFSSGESFPGDSTSFPTSSLLPSNGWSPWSQSPLDLGLLSSPHVPFSGPSHVARESTWHSSLFLNELPLAQCLERNIHPTAAVSQSVLGVVDWEIHKWSRTTTWESTRSVESLLWSSSLQAEHHGRAEAEENPFSASAEKYLWHLWDVNLTRRLPWSPWSIWSNLTSLPLLLPPEDVLPDPHFSSSSPSPEAEDPFKPSVEASEPSYALFPEIEALLDTSAARSAVRYDRSVSEGDLHFLEEGARSGRRGDGMCESYELIPSENSAFRPYFQGHRPLLHVRSTPNIKFNFFDRIKRQDDSKSDSPGEHLYFSSRTHFRPIQTPLGTPENESDFRPRDLFGGYAVRDSQYQRYRDPEEPVILRHEFQPKFKLQKNRDKYIQTSLEEKEEPSAASTSHDPFACGGEQENPENLLGKAEGLVGLPRDERAATPRLEPKEVPPEPWLDKGESELSTSDAPAVVARIRSLWQSETGKEGQTDPRRYSSIWSTGFECDADLQTSGGTGTSTGTSTVPFLPVSGSLSLPPETSTEDCMLGQQLEAEVYSLPPYVSEGSAPEDGPPLSADAVQTDDFGGGFVPIPDDALYSSDLERQWQSETSVTRQSRALTRTRSAKSSNKKPCSFYLEGKCRRSDCRFSHDLSRITCCFWREGNCFKGSLCPFLHGFLSDLEPASSPVVGSASPEFSDLDFPALGRDSSLVHKGGLSRDPSSLLEERASSSLTSRKNHCHFASKHNPPFSSKIIDAN